MEGTHVGESLLLTVGLFGSSGCIGEALEIAIKRLPNVMLKAFGSARDSEIIDHYLKTKNFFDVVIYCSEISDKRVVNSLDRTYIGELGGYIDNVLKVGRKLIYLSSSDVYMASSGLLSEDSPVVADSFYSEVKLFMESKVLENGGIVLRLPTVIGCRNRSGGILAEIDSKIRKDAPNFQNASYLVDVILKQNLVSIICQMLYRDICGIYNCGGGFGGISIRDLVKVRKCHISGSVPPAFNITSIEDQAIGKVMDNRKIIQVLGFRFPITRAVEIFSELRGTLV